MDKKLHKNETINSQIILQGTSYNTLPNIKSNSYHCKSASIPVYVNQGAKSVEEIENIISIPPNSSPPQNKSFMKRMYHRVISSNTLCMEEHDNGTKGIKDEIKLALETANLETDNSISMILESNKVSSKITSSNISQKTDTTNSRVFLLMKLAISARDLSLNASTSSHPKSQCDFIESNMNITSKFTIHNEDYIIPPYYMNENNTKGKLLDIDFGSTIFDSIKNLRALNSYQLEFLKTLSHEKLIEIIREYDHVMRTYIPSMVIEESKT